MKAEAVHHLTGIVLDLALLAGAIAAAIKYRVFNVFGFRWRTDVVCTHHDLADGSVVFLVDYLVNNTGRRPLKLTDVTISVHPPMQQGQLLLPDESRVIASRVVTANDRSLKGIFQIEPGERTIFTLRARLQELAEYVFVICTFSTPAQRTPTVFRSFYVRAARSARPAVATPPAGSGGDDEDDGV